MGTHGALAITYEDGKHRCYEATGDGEEVRERFKRWLDSGLKPETFDSLLPFGWHTTIYEMEDGSSETNDREHDQEYFALVDFKNKEIHTNIMLTSRYHLGKLVYLMGQGWKLEEGIDCTKISGCTSEG